MNKFIVAFFSAAVFVQAAQAQQEQPVQDQQLEEELIPESDQGIEDRQLPETEEEIQSEQEPTMHDEQLEPGLQHVPSQTGENQDIQESLGMEGMQELAPAQLPQPVKQSLQNSKYSLAAVEKAYKVGGKALAHVLNNIQQLPSGSIQVETLYLIQLTTGDNQKAMQYYTAEGELVGEESM